MSSVDTILTNVAASAGVLALVLGITQIDYVSRKILSPGSLYSRRKQEQQYIIQTSLQNWIRKKWPLTERDFTGFAASDEDLTALVKSILDTKASQGGDVGNKPKINGILKGSEDNVTDMEYYLILESSGTTKKIQVPLIRFGLVLAEEMERMLVNTTMCFVADASSGLGSRVLGRVSKECGAGVALVHEPMWMLALAHLISDSPSAIPKEKLIKVVFALCRLEAWRVRDDVGESRTVVFTLPGQNVTSFLLPLLQAAFPCERHVFAYHNATDSVGRAALLRKQGGYTPICADDDGTDASVIAKTSSATLKTMHHLRSLPKSLATLPSNNASTIESWMSSVDTFCQMKEEEGSNGYLPFVLKMQFLFQDDVKITDPNNTNSDVDMVSKLCLKNLLQYMLGTRSRSLKPEILDAANQILVECCKEEKSLGSTPISDEQRKSVEACVFLHKSILIAEKTLPDTVQPKVHWTLKAAKKMSGCACCGPEEESDDEDEDGVEKKDVVNINSNPFGAGLTQRGGGGGRRGYVDGKMGFAFDPTKFSKRGGTRM